MVASMRRYFPYWQWKLSQITSREQVPSGRSPRSNRALFAITTHQQVSFAGTSLLLTATPDGLGQDCVTS